MIGWLGCCCRWALDNACVFVWLVCGSVRSDVCGLAGGPCTELLTRPSSGGGCWKGRCQSVCIFACVFVTIYLLVTLDCTIYLRSLGSCIVTCLADAGDELGPWWVFCEFLAVPHGANMMVCP